MYEAIINKLKDTIRELKFPPLSGKPTEADILVTLDMALDFILSDEVDPDEYAETKERLEDLEFGVYSAVQKLKDLIDDMREKDIDEALIDNANEIRYDLDSL